MKMVCVFFRKVNKCYRGRSCPIIVHCRYVLILNDQGNFCSLEQQPVGRRWIFLLPIHLINFAAVLCLQVSNLVCFPSDGTGRTGTYILIDMVLNRMAKGELSASAQVAVSPEGCAESNLLSVLQG